MRVQWRVQARYVCDEDTVKTLSERIRKGSLGKWGKTVAMPGHGYLSDNELTAILSSIFSLKGKGNKKMSISQDGTTNEHE